MQPRIIFAGTPVFAAQHLAALLDTGIKPVAVYTQPDRPAGRGRSLQASPVKDLALRHKLDVFQPLNLKDASNVATFAQHQADLMIVVAYGIILPQTILDLPKLGCINVHASLLPRWRGAAPIQRAIEAGDTETGVTIMQMDAGLDTGHMLHKKVVPINRSDTSASLHDKLAIAGGQALLEALPLILSGKAVAEPQTDNDATYASKLTKQEGQIDWSLSAEVIDQKIRAFSPWPGAQTNLNGNKIKIKGREFSAPVNGANPGEIISHNNDGLIVQCGKGCMLIEQIQFPGKRMTDVTALLNAYQQELAAGNQFN